MSNKAVTTASTASSCIMIIPTTSVRAPSTKHYDLLLGVNSRYHNMSTRFTSFIVKEMCGGISCNHSTSNVTFPNASHLCFIFKSSYIMILISRHSHHQQALELRKEFGFSPQEIEIWLKPTIESDGCFHHKPSISGGKRQVRWSWLISYQKETNLKLFPLQIKI